MLILTIYRIHGFDKPRNFCFFMNGVELRGLWGLNWIEVFMVLSNYSAVALLRD